MAAEHTGPQGPASALSPTGQGPPEGSEGPSTWWKARGSQSGAFAHWAAAHGGGALTSPGTDAPGLAGLCPLQALHPDVIVRARLQAVQQHLWLPHSHLQGRGTRAGPCLRHCPPGLPPLPAGLEPLCPPPGPWGGLASIAPGSMWPPRRAARRGGWFWVSLQPGSVPGAQAEALGEGGHFRNAAP